jgi:hypothetical protein
VRKKFSRALRIVEPRDDDNVAKGLRIIFNLQDVTDEVISRLGESKLELSITCKVYSEPKGSNNYWEEKTEEPVPS